ncbi:MAG: hypothetical protein ACK5CA_15795 [Cyanobacteriota bacterium]|jgi:hypothetical protein
MAAALPKQFTNTERISMSQTIIEVDLKDLLAKIDNRLDRIEQKLEVLPRLETKLDGLERRVGRLGRFPHFSAEVKSPLPVP